jgi:hypothetical protein
LVEKTLRWSCAVRGVESVTGQGKARLGKSNWSSYAATAELEAVLRQNKFPNLDEPIKDLSTGFQTFVKI